MTNNRETDPLISNEDEEVESQSIECQKRMSAGYKAMPISFLASCAMAATAASTVYAYAHILCRDASRCTDGEKAAYVSAVAAATTIANVCGLLAVSMYERLPTRVALALWIGLRAASVGVLGTGVLRKSVGLALAARVLEGLATDNTLHMALNALYARTKDQRRVGQLMSASLALYMAGMALSPALAALLSDFRVSFAVALVLFALTAVYLAVVGRLENGTSPLQAAAKSNGHSPCLSKLGLAMLARPALYLASDRVVAAHAGAMLMYNAAVSYLFPALMVHATLQFGFSPAYNGLILSVAAGSSSLYLLVAAIVARPARNASAALASLGVLVIALCALAAVSKGWALFPVVAVAALGLATPSFIKSHLVQHRPHDSLAVAALSLVEGTGSLISAPLLGGWQSAHTGGSVLYISAGLAAMSAAIFAVECVRPLPASQQMIST